jgi:hypothetical protein
MHLKPAGAALATALLGVLISRPARAQDTFGGDWALRMAEPAEAPGNVPTVHVALKSPGLNTFYAPLAGLDGLSAAQVAASGPIHFRLRHDAGTFAFDGSFRNGRGTGHFSFAADPAFAAALASRGMQRPTPEQQFSLARHGVGLAYLDELAAQGYARPTTEQMVQAGVNGGDLADLRELGSLGYRLGSVDALIRMNNNGVTPAFVRELATAGYRSLSVDDLLKLRNHSVTVDFVQRMNARAGRQLPVGELVELHLRGEK